MNIYIADQHPDAHKHNQLHLTTLVDDDGRLWCHPAVIDLTEKAAVLMRGSSRLEGPVIEYKGSSFIPVDWALKEEISLEIEETLTSMHKNIGELHKEDTGQDIKEL